MFLAIVVALVAGPLIYFAYKCLTRPENFPPGPLGIPFLGSAIYIKQDHAHLRMLKLAEEYGNVFSLKLWGKDIIVVCGAEANREVLFNKDICGRVPGYIIHLLKGSAPTGITHNVVGPAWVEYRKLFYEGLFLPENKPYEVLDKGASGMIEELAEMSHGGEAVSLTKVTSLGVYSTELRMHFGNLNGEREFTDKEKLSEMFEICKQMADLVVDKTFGLPTLIPGLHKIWLPQSAKKFLSISRAALQYYADQYALNEKVLDPEKPKNFIDIFLAKIKNGGDLPKTDYTDHALRMILFDTIPTSVENVSLTMQYGALYLAGHQDIQEKLHEEIDSVLGSKNEVEASDWEKMPYALATTYEVLRNANVTPTNVTRKTERDVTLLGYSIPKDTPVLMNTYSANLDETKWKNAKKFDPENFLDEEGHFVPSKWFCPLGGGPRKCPGADFAKKFLFAFLVKLIQNFHVKPEKDGSVLDYEPLPGFIRRPKPQKLRLIARE